MTELCRSKTPEEAAEAFASRLLQLVAGSGDFHWALSGGSTPGILFDLLARDYVSRMPWPKIHFWWGDERCVPPSDAESNYQMAFNRLFRKVPVKEDQIHRIKGELPPEEACSQYSTEIRSHVKTRDALPSFDLIMLGIGDDGHTASIFPDQMDLLTSGRICEVATHPVTGQKRVSLTGPVLSNARYLYFLVTGLSKATCIARIVNKEKSASGLPAYHIFPSGDGRLAFFLDQDAASGINTR